MGIQAVKAGKSVYFATLTEIIDTLVQAEREGKLKKHIAYIARPALYRLREYAKRVPENLRLPPITAPVKPKKRRGRPPKRKSSE